MKILVTGSGTLVGNCIASYLMQKKQDIIGTYNKSYPSNLKKNVKLIKLDLSKNFLIKENFNYLIHCASGVPDYNLSKKKIFNVNVLGFRRLLKISKNNDIKKIILLSTTSVYGKIISKKIDENTKFNDPDNYGITKITMEKDLIDFSKKNDVEYVILRLPGVLGKNSDHNFLSKLIKNIKKNKSQKLNLFNKELKFNNLIHIKDLSKIVFQSIKSKKIRGIFLLGSKYPVKFKNLIDMMQKFHNFTPNYKINSNGFSLNLSKSIKYKLKLNTSKNTFKNFLYENLIK